MKRPIFDIRHSGFPRHSSFGLRRSLSASRKGFTLIEMLVVMAIITILAALVIPAAMAALSASQRARNGVDISQVMQALDAYKSAKGSYPPSMGEGRGNANFYSQAYGNGTFRNTLLYRHVITAYPKVSNDDIEHLFADVADKLDQSSALVFWLSQTSDDVRRPFTSQTNFRKFIDFDTNRLVPDNDPNHALPAEPAHNFPGMQLYFYKPPFAKDSYYVYIESKSYEVFSTYTDTTTSGVTFRDRGVSQASVPSASSAGSATGVRPWLNDTNGPNGHVFVNPETYQLFCSGLDGRFASTLPGSVNYLRKFKSGRKADGSAFTSDEFADDGDNQTNFTEGKRIEDLLP